LGVGKNGLRYKAGQPLTFTLYAADNSENQYVTKLCRRSGERLASMLTLSWRMIPTCKHGGLPQLRRAAVWHFGWVDPDVFVYWDSSQANPTSGAWLNLSEYKSSQADEALEAGRTRFDPP